MRKEINAFLFLLIFAVFLFRILLTNTIYDGIYIENISLGGLTIEEAQKKLQAYEQQLLIQNKLELCIGEYQEDVSYEQLGVQYEFSNILEKAYQWGRDQNWMESYLTICSLKKKPVIFPLKISYNEDNIYLLLKELQKNFSQKPKDAIIQRNHGRFNVIKEKKGKKLNITQTAHCIKNALTMGNIKRIEVQIEEWQPQYTKTQLEQIQYLLGSFVTSFSEDKVMRNHNIQQASKQINGILIHPGEIFSTKKVLGEITKENGYVEAPVIIKGNLIKDVGGGICQVVTTLYNAVLFSELEIIERKNHSLPVGYVPLGQDAAFATTWLDFKFQNNTEGLLYIESFTDKNELYVNIYGTIPKEKDRRIEFISKIEEPPLSIITKDKQIKEESKDLYVRLYKRVYNKDQLIEEKVINESYYKMKSTS